MIWYSYDIRKFTAGEYAFWYAQMSREKQLRIDRFRYAEDKQRSVAGEMLAKNAIAAWCGIMNEQITFSAAPGGKPYAVGLPVEFNISHSGNMVVCAIDSQPIGIDVERIRPIDISLARYICSEKELLNLFGHLPEDSEYTYTEDEVLLRRFFELWTAKEALGKRSGIIELNKDISNIRILKSCVSNYIVSICPSDSNSTANHVHC